ncbi:MAG: phosphatidate cytidylyltransferase [Bacteroidetes bacterium]|nr:phosphatidate cytidylyltransferase [Bacteroidota bacterium]
MAMNWPTFFTRLGSAIVFSVIMMAGLLWNKWAFAALASLILVLCLREYFRLMKIVDAEAGWSGWLAPAIIITSLAWLWLSFFTYNYYLLPWVGLLFFPVLILMCTALSKKTAIRAGMYALGGMLYILLPMILLLQLRFISLVIPLALVLMIWMNDTMAYITGSFIGKTPFSEISPKKTWEGTAGGAIFTIAGGAIWGHYSHYYNMTDWMVLALFASVAGTAGDLLKSKIKRMAGVKDSGNIMPGHGGALDRFDSLLAATPFAFCYAYFFMPPVHVAIF